MKFLLDFMLIWCYNDMWDFNRYKEEFVMNRLAKCIRDSEVLTKIQKDMEYALTITDAEQFSDKAESIFQALRDFRKIVRTHKKVPFSYHDVLTEELKCYEISEVPFIFLFDGEKYRTPFSKLATASHVIIKESRNTDNRPANLKHGNDAIGQAWLSDGTEVFCPYEALNHSMNTTAKRLRDWAIHFKCQLAKETR